MKEELDVVHIMMATYNGEKYISEQIDSIINQTYSEWKLWINDDGSTDGTIDIINKYKAKYPQKIIMLCSEVKNLGAKGNFAYLYENTPYADYYAFCDQDDIWKDDKLKTLLQTIEKEDNSLATLIYHDVRVVDKDMKLLSTSFYKYSGLGMIQDRRLHQILMYNYVPGCTMMFNHKLKEKITDIPERCVMHDWWIMLSAICLDANIIKIDNTLGSYRQHESNDMGAAKKKNILQMVLKCMDVINVKKYKLNNIRLKRERIIHIELLLNNYESFISVINKKIIIDYLNILNDKKRFRTLFNAVIKGYIFYDIVYSCKFYIL